MAEDKGQNIDPTEDKGADDGQIQKFTIDGKEYGESEVKNLLAQSGKATQALQQIAKIDKLASQLGTDTDALVENMPYMASAIGNAIDSGVMNTNFEIVKPDPGDNTNDTYTGETEVDDDVLKSIAAELKSLREEQKKDRERLDIVDRYQKTGIQRRYEQEIISANPNLDREDAQKVLRKAMEDKSKTHLEHAKEFAAQKEETLEAIIKKKVQGRWP